MKLKQFLTMFLLLITLTGCVEKITRVETKKHVVTIPPEFSVEEETLKNRISAIIPVEKIKFTSSKTTSSGEEDYHTLSVEIVPDSLPANGLEFYRMTDEIQEAVESGISNMDNYQKLRIHVGRTEIEDGVEHTRSYKKELDL